MTKKQTAVIILAAGKGTRMKSDLPKVLHLLGGIPLISHVINAAKAIDAEKIITVIRPGMDFVEGAISKDSEVVYQEQQLGTAHAVLPALELLDGFDGNILVLYADTPLLTSLTLKNLIKKINDEQNSVAVLGFEPEDPAQYGRLVTTKNGQLSKIVEFNDASDKEKAIRLCNSGVVAIKAEHAKKLINSVDNNNNKQEYYLTDIVKIASNSKLTCGYISCSADEVLGINDRAELAKAEKIFQNRIRYRAMQEGVTLIDPDSVHLSHGTKLGRDVIIHPNVFIGPDVTIEDYVEIKSFSHIEGAHIYEGASIGPFARIRPGSIIEEKARIGNFVEIKKSEVKKGAKIGHLSYIGDSEVGEEANIGAGTITCNYDGENKYKTYIGSKAFIGSNTALVAPVKIGKEAFIAAGSTITDDVESGNLAIARSRQTNKEKKG